MIQTLHINKSDYQKTNHNTNIKTYYQEKDPTMMQSLMSQGETKDAEIQKTEEAGGCSLPEEATQPNAT